MGPRGHLSRNAASDRASKHPNMVAGGAMYPAVGFQAPFKNLELVIINYWIWFRKYNHTARLLSNEHLNNKLWNTKDWNNIIFEWANHVDGWDQQSQQINKAPNRMILEVTVQWRLGTASNPTENQKYTAFPQQPVFMWRIATTMMTWPLISRFFWGSVGGFNLDQALSQLWSHGISSVGHELSNPAKWICMTMWFQKWAKTMNNYGGPIRGQSYIPCKKGKYSFSWSVDLPTSIHLKQHIKLY